MGRAGAVREERTDVGLHDLAHDRFRRRVGEQVVVLCGVLGQVEELAGCHRVLVDDQLVAIGLEGGEAPVLADRQGPGRRRRRVVDARHERAALAVRDLGSAGDLAQRRRHVEVLHQGVDDARRAAAGGRTISGTRTAGS